MTEHLDPNYGRERRSRRSSGTLPSGVWALFGLLLGGLLVLVTALAMRGPAAIVVNSGCCCCQEAPCKPLRGVDTPIRGDRVGETPISTPPPMIPPDSPDLACCDRDRDIVYRDRGPFVPFVPFVPNTPNNPDTPTINGDPTPVPEPGTIVLLIAGAAAMRGIV